MSLMSINIRFCFLIDSKRLFPEYNLPTCTEFITEECTFIAISDLFLPMLHFESTLLISSLEILFHNLYVTSMPKMEEKALMVLDRDQ